MQPFKKVLQPDRKKVGIFMFFVLIMIGGLIQRAPLIESPPSPEPSPLGDFSFTLLSSLLSFPYLALVILISLSGVLPLYHFPWLVLAGNIIYLYFLSSLCVFCYYRYQHRLSKWHWGAIIGAPFLLIALYLIRFQTPPNSMDDWLNYLGVIFIMFLYFYLLICLGFSIQDVVTRKKTPFT